MKKIFALLGLVLAGITLVACNTNSKFQVDVFIYEYSDTYIGSVRTTLENQLKGIQNISYQFHDAGSSQETQNSQIDGAIAKGTQLLVVNIHETASADTVIRKAKNANLPILFFNREVSDEAIKSYDKAAFVGTDPDEAGHLQGSLAVDILFKDGDWTRYDRNGDGKLGYVMLRADLDNPEANGRTKYSIETANKELAEKGAPALVRIGADLMASWSTSTAKQLFDGVIANSDQFNQVDLVFANNDDMAIGAINALKVAGYNIKGGDKFIPVFGVDATSPAKDHIRDGEMAGSILQDGQAMAKCLLDFIVNTSLGKSYTDGTSYTYETGVNKVRIPYAKFTA